MDTGLGRLWGRWGGRKLAVLQFMGFTKSGPSKPTEQYNKVIWRIDCENCAGLRWPGKGRKLRPGSQGDLESWGQLYSKWAQGGASGWRGESWARVSSRNTETLEKLESAKESWLKRWKKWGWEWRWEAKGVTQVEQAIRSREAGSSLCPDLTSIFCQTQIPGAVTLWFVANIYLCGAKKCLPSSLIWVLTVRENTHIKTNLSLPDSTAKKSCISKNNKTTHNTATKDGKPSVRTNLLSRWDQVHLYKQVHSPSSARVPQPLVL